MPEQLDLITRARTAGGDRLATIIELLAATEPPEIIDALLSFIEDLRQEIHDQLSAEEALAALARATHRLLQALPETPETQESQRMAEVLAMIEDSHPAKQRSGYKKPEASIGTSLWE